MNDLSLFCKEFGFSNLLSPFTDFVSAHSVADSKAWHSISDLEAKNRQQDGKRRLLQNEFIDMREVNKAQMQDIAAIREGRSHEATEFSCLAGKNISLAEASRLQQQEIVALGCAQAKSDKEMRELRAQLAQEQTNQAMKLESMKRDIAELREAQRREIGALRCEFTKWDRGLREKLAIANEAREALRQ
jgi:ribosomal protein L29